MDLREQYKIILKSSWPILNDLKRLVISARRDDRSISKIFTKEAQIYALISFKVLQWNW